MDDIKDLLRQYVENNSRSVPLLWDPNLSSKFPCDPKDRSPDNLKRIAHLLLLSASISDTEIIGRAENARGLISHLYEKLGTQIYTTEKSLILTEEIRRSPQYEEYGSEKIQAARILASTNTFIRSNANQDLIQYSKGFNEPEQLVKTLSKNIQDMDGPGIEKAWMYLRWMTRPHPDLDIFSFNTAHLKLPLTSHIRRVASSLNIIPDADQKHWSNLENREKAREAITDYAKELFPNDPCKVDYPLYLLGRWLEGKPKEPINEYLHFFNDLYSKTGSAPVRYDIVSKLASNFERNVREELRKQHVFFQYESITLNLGNGITYKPDFILPKTAVEGKHVVLEPHGIWREGHEEEVTAKYAQFRELYGNYYYLILLVHPNEYYRIRDIHPESYDDIVEGRGIADLLYMLKNNRYRNIFKK